MALKVWNGSSWVSATGLKVWNGSSWATASNGKVWNGSSWVTFFSNMAVTGSVSVFGGGTRSGTGSNTITTTAASVTVTGGSSPYTYAWQYVSGDTAGVSTDTSSSTTFFRNMTITSLGQTVELIGYYRCKVTDNNGTIVYGPTCMVDTVLSETS